MKYFFCLVISALLFSCKENVPAQSDQSESQIKTENKNTASENSALPSNGDTPVIFKKNVEAGKVNFNISAKNGETSTIHVACDDFEIRKYKNDFNVEGQLVDAFGLDLNNDNFYELYLVIKGNDDSDSHNIIGIASYNDKSAGEINIKEINGLKLINSDKIYSENGQLIRELKNDNGEFKKYQYQLIKGEAGFILEPVQL